MSAAPKGAVGTDRERVDGRAKVTGAARYSYEVQVPGVAFVVPVLSTVGRGTITTIDTAAAEAEPGVITVLHKDNAPSLNHGTWVTGELFILQGPEVAYRGQVVAGVVAESFEAATEAAGLVEVTYEETEFDVILRADHPDIFEPEVVNAGEPGQVHVGDVEAGLAAAAIVVDSTYRTAVEHHHPMEPHATTALWEDDGLTLYDANQGPWWVSQAYSEAFGLELQQVRVISDYVGGGFGSKGNAHPSEMLTVMAAKAIDRPVKIALTRVHMTSMVEHRPPSIQRVRLGARPDGKLTAVDHESLTYTSRLVDYFDQICASTGVLYGTPNLRTAHSGMRLDVPSPGYMRGPGHTSGMVGLEIAMDELAVALEMDPVELRILNDAKTEPASGLEFSSRSLVRALRTGADHFGWDPRGAGDSGGGPRREGSWLIGSGVASAHHPDYTYPTVARARAFPTGGYAVAVGAVDIGTGTRTAMLLIAADALGVDPERIDLTIGRSATGMAVLAGGSTGTASWGWAVAAACRDLLAAVAEHDGPLPPEGLEVIADTSEEVAAQEPLARHTFGAHFAEVAVDEDTGQVRVRRMVGSFAAGRIINPRAARSQYYGGMIMALGQALLEHSDMDPQFGDFANHDLASYHFTANADVPRLEVLMLEEEDRSANLVGGPKGLGELCTVGAAAAIANALHNATGHRFREVPIRIEEVRAALRG
jgi:xanthine dehydrogenase YagR molybdenum-binding subunit